MRTWTKRRKIAAALAALAAFLAFVAGAPYPARAEAIPVLANPSFEEGFTEREAGEVKVAVGWDYAYLSGDDRWCRSPCNRPEYLGEWQEHLVTDGDWSQRWHSKFSRHFGVVHQEVAAERGAWYEFSCDVQVLSDPPGDLGAFVGINPWGGGVFDRTMVWGRESVGPDGWIYGRFVRASVTAQAFGDSIRVAAASNNRWATRDNTAYVDACSIRRVDGPGGGATPTPCPTRDPGGGSCPSLAEVRAAVETVIADREPVRWPR